ncbi:hypothetical protein N7454_009990 [Penicillium verhagenii]|nr:hypothetical protein N7454_009990 [Penicillium verhagenii]
MSGHSSQGASARSHFPATDASDTRHQGPRIGINGMQKGHDGFHDFDQDYEVRKRQMPRC